MQCRQASTARRGAGFVIELGKDLKLRIANTDDAVAMASGVPFAILSFYAATSSGAIMLVTGIHRGRRKRLAK